MIPCFKCPVLGCCLKISFICFISIGHLLGLSHDDSKFCEENFGSMEDKRLMSSILTSIDSSKPWSKCTSATITEFFDDGHGMYYHTFYQLCVSFYCDLFLIRIYYTSLFIPCLIFKTILEVLAKQGKSLKGWQSLTLLLHGSNAREKKELM